MSHVTVMVSCHPPTAGIASNRFKLWFKEECFLLIVMKICAAVEVFADFIR
jgi:hypothetical protein